MKTGNSISRHVSAEITCIFHCYVNFCVEWSKIIKDSSEFVLSHSPVRPAYYPGFLCSLTPLSAKFRGVSEWHTAKPHSMTSQQFALSREENAWLLGCGTSWHIIHPCLYTAVFVLLLVPAGASYPGALPGSPGVPVIPLRKE